MEKIEGSFYAWATIECSMATVLTKKETLFLYSYIDGTKWLC